MTRIGIKTTHLRSPRGELLVLGNGDVLSSPIRNFGRMKERRIVLALGVTYDTALDHVQASPGMIREAVERRGEARFDRAHFRGCGESALEFEAVYRMVTPEYSVYLDEQQAINLELLHRFREAGIEFRLPDAGPSCLRPDQPPRRVARWNRALVTRSRTRHRSRTRVSVRSPSPSEPRARTRRRAASLGCRWSQ